jgi:hypothetical protein
MAWPVLGQNGSNDTHARLSLVNGKQTYQIGEPVKLLLEFTADRDGYQVDTVTDTSESVTETVSVSPESGVSHWRRDHFGLGYRCVISSVRLSTNPTRIEFMLNDSLKFDSSGLYSVKVTTRRVSPVSSRHEHQPIILTTNEVSFQIEPMSDREEEEHVQRLSNVIDATNDPRIQAAACEELNFLTGDPSSREKVRRFLGSEVRQCVNIYYGLFAARNRTLMSQLLEAELRDETTPVTPVLLAAVTKLQLLRERAGSAVKPTLTTDFFNPNSDPRASEIQEAYVAELAAGLAKRTGKAQTTTAMTILAHLPKEPQSSAALLLEVRSVLLTQFDSLHPFDQESLMRVYWDKMRDPSLVPLLKKMLNSNGIASKNIHDTALRRLLELAPDEAKPYLISEIRDPRSLVDLEILSSLSDKSLSEVDESLLEQIRRLASSQANFDRVYLKHKASLAARFATKAIYADLMDIYRSAGDKLPTETRAGFLAYFAKHNEEEALSLTINTVSLFMSRNSKTPRNFMKDWPPSASRISGATSMQPGRGLFGPPSLTPETFGMAWLRWSGVKANADTSIRPARSSGKTLPKNDDVVVVV